MFSSLRSRIIALVMCVNLLSLGSLGYFFIRLYRADRVSELLRGNLSGTTQNAKRLENLLAFARLMHPSDARQSSEIVYLISNPCDPKKMEVTASKVFEPQLQELKVNMDRWLQSSEFLRGCSLIQNRALGDHPMLLPNNVPMPMPYLVALLSSKQAAPSEARLVMLSMDGFQGSYASTHFLTNKEAEVLWTSDGENYLKSALRDTGLNLGSVKRQIETDNTANVNFLGLAGVLASSPVGEQWLLWSLSYSPTMLRPVKFAMAQAIFLFIGIGALGLLLARRGAFAVSAPLIKLKEHAESIGAGNMKVQAADSEVSEIAAVQTAFNLMVNRIGTLISQVKKTSEMEADLKVAEEVQRLLIPSNIVQAKDHRLYSYFKSASQCGGDWWGYLDIDREGGKREFVLLVGDVTGHGVSSALVSATAQGALSMLKSWCRSQPDIDLSPTLLLSFLNRVVFEAAKGNIGMTLFAVVIDPISGSLRCANAGHCYPYLISQDSAKGAAVTQIGKPGMPLGYSAESEEYVTETHPWTPKAQIFLYTDGLIDAPSDVPKFFDRRTLRKSLSSFSRLRGRDLLMAMIDKRTEFNQGVPQVDDVTGIVCEFVPDNPVYKAPEKT